MEKGIGFLFLLVNIFMAILIGFGTSPSCNKPEESLEEESDGISGPFYDDENRPSNLRTPGENGYSQDNSSVEETYIQTLSSDNQHQTTTNPSGDSPFPDFPYLWGSYSMVFRFESYDTLNHDLANSLMNGYIMRTGYTLNLTKLLFSRNEYNNNGAGICDNSMVLFRLLIRLGIDADMATIDGHYNTTHYDYSKVTYQGWPGEEAVIWSDPEFGLLFDNDTGTDIIIAMKNENSTLSAEIYGKAKNPRRAELQWLHRKLDGEQIRFKRTVKDKRGNILGEGIFTSKYSNLNAGYEVPADYSFFHDYYETTLPDGYVVKTWEYIAD